VNGGRKISFTGQGAFIFQDANPVQRFTGSKSETVESEARKLLEGLGFNMGLFVLDKYDAAQGSMEFVEKYDNKLVYDNYFKLDIKDGFLSWLEGMYRSIKGYSKLPGRIIPIYQVLLLWDFSTAPQAAAIAPVGSVFVPDGASIARIDLGFKRYGTGQDSGSTGMKEYTESPAWRVIFDDGREIYFKAYDGQVLNTSPN